MARTIWKFPLDPTMRRQTVRMPKAAKVLSVQVQHGAPFLWAEVDPEAPPEDRVFECVETGGELRTEPDTTLAYFNTIHLHAGLYVLHVYERRAY